MRKIITILAAAVAATALSACAGHRELKAPCADDQGIVSSLLSSPAFASDVNCGPLVRQDGVSVL
ncbi:hypothetical protein G6L32_14275 [Agrobacterium tumefaciens]|uniref:hypothetical protein n=1 Tax=Agrobacterium tumefaciens TaxID=358 RepID=UPI001573825C|nr:hypothetical protein [Agrobacterium tumefaciens]